MAENFEKKGNKMRILDLAVTGLELCMVVVGGFVVIRSAILKWNRIDLLSIDTPISLMVIVYHFVMILIVIYLLSLVLFR